MWYGVIAAGHSPLSAAFECGNPNWGAARKRKCVSMSRITSSVAFAAIIVAFGAQSGVAADHAKRGHAARHSNMYMSYRGPSATLPYGPEYGFLAHVPANAIRGPGYIFVPGVGILGESCNLPSSACTNEYRDIR